MFTIGRNKYLIGIIASAALAVLGWFTWLTLDSGQSYIPLAPLGILGVIICGVLAVRKSQDRRKTKLVVLVLILYLAVLGHFLTTAFAYTLGKPYTIKTAEYTHDYRNGYRQATACPSSWPNGIAPLLAGMSGTTCDVDCTADPTTSPAPAGPLVFSTGEPTGQPAPESTVYRGFPFTIYRTDPGPCEDYTFPVHDFIPGMVLDALYLVAVTALFGIALRRLNDSSGSAW